MSGLAGAVHACMRIRRDDHRRNSRRRLSPPRRGAHPRLIDELYRSWRNYRRRCRRRYEWFSGGCRERRTEERVRRRREETLKTFVCKHALVRSCSLFLSVGIRSAGDYGTKWLAFHAGVRIRARDQNDNPLHSFFALRCEDGLPIIDAHLYAQIMAREDYSVHPDNSCRNLDKRPVILRNYRRPVLSE